MSLENKLQSTEKEIPIQERMDIKLEYELSYKKLRRLLLRHSAEEQVKELDKLFEKGMQTWKRNL